MENSMNMDREDLGKNLAYAALDEIPTPKADAKEIVGLVKSSGKITGYQLSDGQIVSKQEGVDMAKNNHYEERINREDYRLWVAK